MLYQSLCLVIYSIQIIIILPLMKDPFPSTLSKNASNWSPRSTFLRNDGRFIPAPCSEEDPGMVICEDESDGLA